MQPLHVSLKARVIFPIIIVCCFSGCNGDEDSDTAGEGDPQADLNPSFAVSLASPSNGSLGVHPDSLIEVTFNNDIDPCTVTFRTFMVTAGGVSIPGELRVKGNIVTFIPTQTLSSFTTYTIRVSSAVRDIDGNPLPFDFIATFTTSDMSQTSP